MTGQTQLSTLRYVSCNQISTHHQILPPVDVHFSLPLMGKGVVLPLPAWSKTLARHLKQKRYTFSFPKNCMSMAPISVPSPIETEKKQKQKVVVISGPTGAGKTRLALELAKKLNGEIISADSVQVYRGLDIGSAKPSISDRNDVPHHLIDILDPSEEYSAGQFFEDARKATKDVLERGCVPIIAGGTGLYLRWYVYGKPDVPKASVEVASEVFSELGQFQERGQWDEAVEYVVKAGDPKARSFPYNNWHRLRRSLEIIRSSGSPPSAFQVPYDSYKVEVEPIGGTRGKIDGEVNAAKDLEYDFICLFLSSPRVELYRSIDLRCEDMLMDTEGLLSEASWLLDVGLLPNMNSATRAIGYRQAMEYLLECRQEGGKSCPDSFGGFLFEFQKASRNFAKRQLTWFRNERIYHWVDASQPLEGVLNFIFNAYHNGSEKLVVPASLKMRKDVNDRRETIELKSYRARNRLFVQDKDCHHILDWVRRTQQR